MVGWKIAATSAAGQAHIRVNGPLAGRLLSGQIDAEGATLSLDGNRMQDFDTFDLGPLTLQRGLTLPTAHLAYKTYGTLNSDKSNVILYPTSYGAHHTDIDWLIGSGRVLDPTRYFIVIPNQLGNGLSTSPSTIRGQNGADTFEEDLVVRARPRRRAGGEDAGDPVGEDCAPVQHLLSAHRPAIGERDVGDAELFPQQSFLGMDVVPMCENGVAARSEGFGQVAWRCR